MKAPRPLHPAALPAGTVVGPWRVVGLRGRGTYGAVYLAERVGHEEAGLVALKIALHPLDPRFEREGELLSRIHHPNVPRLHDVGWWIGPGGVPHPYLVMEWVEGVSLYEWAREGGRGSREVMRVLAQVARALEATHAAEGVHRDVKGENIRVRSRDGSAVLLDFGSGNYRGARTLTQPPLPPGTPQYWSPESLRFQWRFRRDPKAHYKADPADDVYALGMMAWRLVTGEYPRAAPGPEEVGEVEDDSWLNAPVLLPPEALSGVSPELAALILRMLSNEPSERGRAGEVALKLEGGGTARRAADRLSMPSEDSTPAERATRPASCRPTREGWRVFLAVVAVSLVAFSLWRLELPPAQLPEEVAQEASEQGREDGGTTSLAETTAAEGASPETSQPGQGGFALEMTKGPLPGQRRPPCKRPWTEINGGCWGRFDDASPPCGDNAYEWKDGCFWPIYTPSRPPTSEPR